MPTVLQNILPAIDAARNQLTTIGLRLYRIFVRTRTWSGGGLGQGTFTDVDVELLPRPRVMAQMTDGEFSPLGQVRSQAGDHFEGHLRVDRISATILLATLAPSVSANQKVYYVVQGIDGGEIVGGLYVLAGAPFRKTTQWILFLEKVEA